MTAETYRAELALLVSQLRVISMVDIPGHPEAISHADAVGPLFDPTLWIKNRDKMAEDKQLLEALLPAWKFAQELKVNHDIEEG